VTEVRLGPVRPDARQRLAEAEELAAELAGQLESRGEPAATSSEAEFDSGRVARGTAKEVLD